MDNIEYLSAEFVLFIHYIVIDEEFCEYGGHVRYSDEIRGIKDTNLFNSALMLPQQSFDGKDLYPDVITKAACYLRSFSMNHPFFDGNKRTAVMSTLSFLTMNGYKTTLNNDELYDFVKKVVEEKLSVEDISEKLKTCTKISKLSKLKQLFREVNNKLKKN